MENRYLLVESGSILAEFAEQREAFEFMQYMHDNHQDRYYSVVDSDLME